MTPTGRPSTSARGSESESDFWKRLRITDVGTEGGYFRKLLATLPQGESARFITPEEIAAATWFLASSEAAPITGVTLPIEWGVTAGY